MPSIASLETFIALIEAGNSLQALQQFYADDACMQENSQPPRVGLPALLAFEEKALASVEKVWVRPGSGFFVNGEQSVIHWVIEITYRDGRRACLDELAHQTWRGEKIVFERFYYDPAMLE